MFKTIQKDKTILELLPSFLKVNMRKTRFSGNQIN